MEEKEYKLYIVCILAGKVDRSGAAAVPHV